MVWVPGGALVAGTPKDMLPRRADSEMLGEQVILHGYYIDVFPYPNEEGAIPLTNVDKAAAEALCQAQSKRLCTELEWERACKGPDNHVYEYGDRHRPDRCGTGVLPSLRPSGLLVGCRSDFGVRDMHGGAFEWTSSRWNRGVTGEVFTTRGGNGTAGEVVGRCANGEGRPAETRSGVIGFRCCSSPQNPAEVTLPLRFGPRLEEITRIDKQRSSSLLGALPDEARTALARGGTARVERLWNWRPVANEDLYVASICSGIGRRPVCGVEVVHEELGKSSTLAWASSGMYIASLHPEPDLRDVWLLGGDEVSRFKRLIAYSWGRISVGPQDRNVAKADGEKKKDKKKKRKTAASKPSTRPAE